MLATFFNLEARPILKHVLEVHCPALFCTGVDKGGKSNGPSVCKECVNIAGGSCWAVVMLDRNLLWDTSSVVCVPAQVLDRLLLYLRVVHSVDYYNQSEYASEDEMPNRCGIMHARGSPPSSKVTPQEGKGVACLALNAISVN